MSQPFNRRHFLKATAATACASSLLRGKAYAEPEQEPVFFFVIAASGGATIIDSLMPIPKSQTQTAGLVSYADTSLESVAGSAFVCPKPLENNSIQGALPLGNGFPISQFLRKHTADTIAVTQEVSSVNHNVAAKRAMTGNDIHGGRTITEEVAMAFGRQNLLANCNMAAAGYLENGHNAQTAAYALAEPIADPLMFALGLHHSRGIKAAPSVGALQNARNLRALLEKESPFLKRHEQERLMAEYMDKRQRMVNELEKGNLIDQLLLLEAPAGSGLTASGDMATLLSKFPNIAKDPFQAQAALGFLLAKNRLATAVTMGLAFNPVFEGEKRVVNAPIAFDWSHQDHMGAQNAMWSRVLQTVDGLMDLLKATDLDPQNPTKGKMWQRSFIFIATEFGRDKILSGQSSGHHLNNGNILISPMLKGNKIYGGVDTTTGLTYGFDPATGVAHKNLKAIDETGMYSLICHALGIEFEGRKNFAGVVKKA